MGWCEKRGWDEKTKTVGVAGWTFGTGKERRIVLRESYQGPLGGIGQRHRASALPAVEGCLSHPGGV
jgi:hypothetical protein